MRETLTIAILAALAAPSVATAVESEQEGVSGLGIAGIPSVDFLVRAATALVFDQAFALLDRCDGEHAVAMDVGATGCDLAWHAGSGLEEWRKERLCLISEDDVIA